MGGGRQRHPGPGCGGTGPLAPANPAWSSPGIGSSPSSSQGALTLPAGLKVKQGEGSQWLPGFWTDGDTDSLSHSRAQRSVEGGGGRWEAETVDRKLVPPPSTAFPRQKAPKGTCPSPPPDPPPAWSPAGLWGSVPLLKPYVQTPLFSPGALSTRTPGVWVPGHWCWDGGHLWAMTRQRESSPSAHVPVNVLRPSPPHPGNWKGQDCHLHRMSGRTPSPESN